MKTQSNTRRGGFSLIELVIVVVIIGIIAAIAIPRLSRATAGASDSALSGDTAVLRNAIDLYSAEHGGAFPAVGTFDTQMTQYTDASGGVSATKDTTHIYGPYLRKVPALKVGTNKGLATVLDGSSGTPGTATGGWFYNASTGDIKANLADTEKDAAAKSYNTY
ncbi:MAG: prepilin-type N-terminal cleavage/methylation domain-containing protein [Planctomycetes bacterium]|nr:prepilin-type N-terminal cleavage/methylation domain-containing protein [Planctomycetota bacterium]